MLEFVILTNKNSISGRTLLSQCIKNKIPVKEVIIIKQDLRYYINLFNFVCKRVGLFQASFFAFIKLLTDFVYEQFLEEIPKIEEILKNSSINTKTFKSNKNWQKEVNEYFDIKQYKIILIGQIGILGKQFNLERNDRIFLNCHPGKLPEYRGIDSFKWAILENKFNAFESTIHIVRPKLDFGEIVSSKKYNINKISWFFGDRQLLIVSAKHLANYINKAFNEEKSIKDILISSKKQKSGKLRFKMGILKEFKSFIIYLFNFQIRVK